MNYPSVIIIGGEAGSGKSTTVELLAKKLGYETLQSGELVRAVAKERGYTIEEFSEIAKKDPELDKEIEKRALQEARKGNIIIQSRVLAFLEDTKNLPSVVTIYIDAPPEVRAGRIAKREGITAEEARKNFEYREANNKERYHDIYGLDTSDRSVYDLVIDNSALSPQETLDAILSHIQES